MTVPLTLDIAHIEPTMFGLVGGKAANLAVLLRAGFLVPTGTCITTAAYARVVGNALDDVLAELATASPEDRSRLAALARDIVRSAPVPDDIADAVRRAVPAMPVAVRSSATAEDLPHASFAGQQDTYLNVAGPDVLDAVRRCWASLWTDRAVAYRAANGIDHGAVRLAVVVQDMVDADVAGVMFTANPVTGRRRQAVIDASPGLGEAVVSGAVNPDHFVVDVETGQIGERRLAGRVASLTDPQVGELARLGGQVETHFGHPQDIEWALAAGRFWLTQSRPITTLFPIPPGRGGHRAFFSASVAQGVYRPFTPMGIACLKAAFVSPARLWGIHVDNPLDGPPAMTVAAGRLFVDVTAPLRNRLGRAVVPRVLDVMEARSAVALRSLFDDPRFSVVPGSRARILRTLARILVRHRVPIRMVHALVDPAAARRRVDQAGERLRARLPVPPDATASQRLDHVEHLLTREFAPLALTVLPRAGAGFAMLGVAAWLLEGHARPGEIPTTIRSLPHNVTTQMDLALWRLATRVRQDPSSLDTGLRDFLAVYGHRAVAEIDLGLPRWSEDPTYIRSVLDTYVRMDDESAAPDLVFDRGARNAEAMTRELAGRVGGVRGRVVRFALGRARELMGLRETPKFFIVTMLAAARSQLATVGAELAARGLLDDADDVFFLDLREVRGAVADGVDFRQLVVSRRAEYDRELRRRHVPRVVLSDGTEPEAVAASAVPPSRDGVLSGTAASAGVVTGTARVVLDPADANLIPGEILVCPSTDPGWTPLFLTAGGLVMEMGGANSHGAVVAREYGIPAVVGVPLATEQIRTGDTVTVDGTSGTVVLPLSYHVQGAGMQPRQRSTV